MVGLSMSGDPELWLKGCFDVDSVDENLEGWVRSSLELCMENENKLMNDDLSLQARITNVKQTWKDQIMIKRILVFDKKILLACLACCIRLHSLSHKQVPTKLEPG